MHINKVNGQYVIELSQSEHDYFEKEIHDMDEELVNLRQKNKLLEEEANRWRNNYHELEASIKIYKLMARSYYGMPKEEKKELVKENEALIEEAKLEIEDLEKDLQRFRSERGHYKSQCEKLEKENVELKEKLTELEHINHDTNNILGKINTTLQKDKEALLKENKKLKEKFADLSSGRDCFRTLYNYYSNLCYKRFEEIDALELENKKLRSKIHNLNIRLDKLNAVEDIITKEGE